MAEGSIMAIPERQLDKILSAARAIVEGDFDVEVDVEASGVVGEIAYYINETLKNLRTMGERLDANVKDTPRTVSDVEFISEKTEQATLMVLDRAEDILTQMEGLRAEIDALRGGNSDVEAVCQRLDEKASAMEGHVFEIINSQEFQDLTKQKLARIVTKLKEIEDRLVSLLIVFKIKENASTQDENLELLKNLHDADVAEGSKQDLVDQLLAEFGI